MRVGLIRSIITQIFAIYYRLTRMEGKTNSISFGVQNSHGKEKEGGRWMIQIIYFTIFLSPLQSFHMKQVSRRSIHIDHLVNTI